MGSWIVHVKPLRGGIAGVMGQLGDLPLLCGQVHGMVKAGHKESSDAVAATYTPSPLNIYAKRHART